MIGEILIVFRPILGEMMKNCKYYLREWFPVQKGTDWIRQALLRLAQLDDHMVYRVIGHFPDLRALMITTSIYLKGED